MEIQSNMKKLISYSPASATASNSVIGWIRMTPRTQPKEKENITETQQKTKENIASRNIANHQ